MIWYTMETMEINIGKVIGEYYDERKEDKKMVSERGRNRVEYQVKVNIERI